MEDTQNAFNKALRYLTQRDRSEFEIRSYLLKKEFSCDTISDVINKLKDLNYLDDVRFGEKWTQYRIETKSFGKIRIRQELYQKGLDSKLIDQIVDQLYQSVDEFELAKSCASKKYKGMKNLTIEKQLRRLKAFLHRQGFNEEITSSVISSLLKNDEV